MEWSDGCKDVDPSGCSSSSDLGQLLTEDINNHLSPEYLLLLDLTTTVMYLYIQGSKVLDPLSPSMRLSREMRSLISFLNFIWHTPFGHLVLLGLLLIN